MGRQVSRRQPLFSGTQRGKVIVKKVLFLNELRLTVLMDNSFRLVTPFYVKVFGQEVIIPAGFKTDLASVPRIPVVYLAVGGRGHKAAVLHDWLYSTARFSRLKCDQCFYHALRESGVDYFAAQVMYLGVRFGGGTWYEANVNKLKELQKP